MDQQYIMSQLDYQLLVNKKDHRHAEAWCRKNLGTRWSAIDNRQGIWSCFWAGPKNNNNYLFYFKNESDAIIFALKWT